MPKLAKQQETSPVIQGPEFESGTDLEYSDNKYDNDCEELAQYARCVTGFDALDNLDENGDPRRSFYSGLYVIGGVPSLGKTTFARQLADNQAELKRPVLYYSLEQSKCELLSKSIARILFQGCARAGYEPDTPDAPPCYTALDVRTVRRNDRLVHKAKEVYFDIVGDRITTYCTNFGASAQDIRNHAAEQIRGREDEQPVIIVDYLQILKPSSSGMTDKAKVDEAMRIFKGLQQETRATVVLISSLNRSNYLATIDYSSFKESGGIEYGADVIMGLELEVITDEKAMKDLGKEDKLSKLRELYNDEKARKIRKVKAICIKNRNGIAHYTANLRYCAKYETFLSKGEYKWADK